jgi:chloride channel protein, CIC family
MKSAVWIKSFNRWLNESQYSEPVLLVLASGFIGLTTGAGVWAFKKLIEVCTHFSFTTLAGWLSTWGHWTIALIPVLGGLIVGLLVHFYIGEERHHGVAGIMEAVALAGGRLRYQRIVQKTVGAAISIGSGASVGPEDPSVQIGANLGSLFGQKLHLSDSRMRAVVAAGAASGIAAAFNAPIAGVFFALEVILGELSGSAFIIVVLSAVVSAVFTQAVSGVQPAFYVPTYVFHSAIELPFYLVLGLLAGPVSAFYVWLLYKMRDLFGSWKCLPRWAKPAVAGLLVGIVGIFLPQIFGVGYATIEAILRGENFAVSLLLAIMLAKLVMTAVSIGGGFLGGLFAPALVIGAALGAALGTLSAAMFPGLQIDPPAFALVGMAAVLAGSVHAPLTAIILRFEMTNDYRIILPLMFAVVISLWISKRIENDSVYHISLARKGIRLERGRDVEVLEMVTVRDVMQTDPDTLLETDSLENASDRFLQTHHHGLPVVNQQGDLIGIFTLQDLDNVDPHEWATHKIGKHCSKDLVVAYPDEKIGVALRRMAGRDLGRLPVVEVNQPRHLVGLLRRTDLVRAYDIALTRREAQRHRAHQVRLDAVTSAQVKINEIVIEEQASCAGKRVNEVAWPEGCLIASLQHGREVCIPHGDTVLKAGDTLVVVTEGEALEEVKRLCQHKTEEST